ncbi:uncharacterized protein LOC116850198 [Odontomachus brunneus]|uniref:uncharacterized protein LOC116850198 n=1 Tax=Odontomachus brunneus TaxID=486640 RepID=UPI0013F26260|nr:uncharacterized protein LOC116850198 [Odontomachus brunneus]
MCETTKTVGKKRYVIIYNREPLSLPVGRSYQHTETFQTLTAVKLTFGRCLFFRVFPFRVGTTSDAYAAEYVYWIVSACECQCSVNVASDCPKCHDEAAGNEMLDQRSRTPGRDQRYVIYLQLSSRTAQRKKRKKERERGGERPEHLMGA